MIWAMAATLYVIPGSAPSMGARTMLEAKGIPYKRRDLIPVASRGVLRAAGFPGMTVPALTIDGRKIQGTGAIARHLDRVRATPKLLPGDPERRLQVETVEQWADHVLQGSARRIAVNALNRDRSRLRGYSEGAKLGLPLGVAMKTAAPVMMLWARFHEADDEHAREDLAQLPKLLDKIDASIAEGVVGGEEPNVADFQIASSLRLLLTLDDVRPAIEGRPAGELAMRLVPDFPGRVPPTFPAEWLEPLRAAAAA